MCKTVKIKELRRFEDFAERVITNIPPMARVLPKGSVELNFYYGNSDLVKEKANACN